MFPNKALQIDARNPKQSGMQAWNVSLVGGASDSSRKKIQGKNLHGKIDMCSKLLIF